MKFILFFLSFGFCKFVFSCTCDEKLDIEYLHEKSTYVFIGGLESKWRFFSPFKNKYNFQIIKTFKGERLAAADIWSDKSSSSCGADFQKKFQYVIFAYPDGNGLITSRCSSWATKNKNLMKIFNDFYKSEDGF